MTISCNHTILGLAILYFGIHFQDLLYKYLKKLNRMKLTCFKAIFKFLNIMKVYNLGLDAENFIWHA